MARVPELASAVLAGEAALVVVDQHVVVEAVLSRERLRADQTDERLDACAHNQHAVLLQSQLSTSKLHTVFDLISEHTLVSGHPPFCAGEDYCQST